MNLTESLQGVELPSDLSFIPWLAERGLTDLVVSVVDNLRPYFPESAFRLERVEDPETLNEVLVVVRPQAHVSADEIIASLDRFDDEWLFEQDPEVSTRVCVFVT